MAFRLTNQALGRLLLDLGFQPGEANERHQRVWRHPESGCTFVLPANKVRQAPRPADVVGIKAQLSLHGHLDEADFASFTREGKLPARSAVETG